MAKYGSSHSLCRSPTSRADHAQGEQFVRFASDPTTGRCWSTAGGMGRAGCMAALVRYSFDGWSMTTALKEATRYRPMSWPIFGGQRRFLEKWARPTPRRNEAGDGGGAVGSVGSMGSMGSMGSGSDRTSHTPHTSTTPHSG